MGLGKCSLRRLCWGGVFGGGEAGDICSVSLWRGGNGRLGIWVMGLGELTLVLVSGSISHIVLVGLDCLGVEGYGGRRGDGECCMQWIVVWKILLLCARRLEVGGRFLFVWDGAVVVWGRG